MTNSAPPELVVAKLLGAYALPHFAQQDVRAVWLTPILTDPVVANALARVNPGRHLAIGGTADPSWRPDLIGTTSARLIEVEAANHSLVLKSKPWRDSAESQLAIIDQIVTHLLS
ncbi:MULTISPECIES: hypothetical protein [Cryobacterium]|uniref:hypothetical protein n=1 Tax=Cryobacterium TaxID=69578 RepID=UPI0010575AE6|nr:MULTISPECIES: hypothetical protein [Cryobacterium]TFC41988.1 hypothetical protein E3O57_16445 [Cryobacterium sp. TMN-39-2]